MAQYVDYRVIEGVAETGQLAGLKLVALDSGVALRREQGFGRLEGLQHLRS